LPGASNGRLITGSSVSISIAPLKYFEWRLFEIKIGLLSLAQAPKIPVSYLNFSTISSSLKKRN